MLHRLLYKKAVSMAMGLAKKADAIQVNSLEEACALLSINPDKVLDQSSLSEVRKRWLTLLATWHPDRWAGTGEEEKATRITKELNAAFDFIERYIDKRKSIVPNEEELPELEGSAPFVIEQDRETNPNNPLYTIFYLPNRKKLYIDLNETKYSFSPPRTRDTGDLIYTWKRNNIATEEVIKAKNPTYQKDKRYLVFEGDNIAFFLLDAMSKKLNPQPGALNWTEQKVYKKVMEICPKIAETIYGIHVNHAHNFKEILQRAKLTKNPNMVVDFVDPDDPRVKPGTAGVLTADGKMHLVDKSSDLFGKRPLYLDDLKVKEEVKLLE